MQLYIYICTCIWDCIDILEYKPWLLQDQYRAFCFLFDCLFLMCLSWPGLQEHQTFILYVNIFSGAYFCWHWKCLCSSSLQHGPCEVVANLPDSPTSSQTISLRWRFTSFWSGRKGGWTYLQAVDTCGARPWLQVLVPQCLKWTVPEIDWEWTWNTFAKYGKIEDDLAPTKVV